ncbi:MAG: [Ribosomal protein S5]-alanine N-acetyltransferase [Sodalis sp.]|nr:MAG: [Ribosomal protein S5]-alanine N-acetyltransferase [Sodalis sp.]
MSSYHSVSQKARLVTDRLVIRLPMNGTITVWRSYTANWDYSNPGEPLCDESHCYPSG